MANVLRYLTGALSKRAKRRGNLAVGIGEESYGPSSTTGYYNGITPPDGGFVVYATGSNGNPKIFVANSEDDLPAIARTLGGGVLDYLAAKNYIAGLSHAWILDSVPNNAITDGLVLDLNAKNPSSFIDNLPATNVLNNNIVAGNGASLGTDAFGTYVQMPNASSGYSYIRLPNIPVSSDETYTWSFELFTTETFTQSGNYAFDTNEYSDQFPASNDLSRLSASNLRPNTIPANTWTKFWLTVTMKSGLTGAYTYDFFNFYLPTFQNKRVYYRNMQFERSGTATPYIGQGATRSQNTTIYDLSGVGNNGTLVNGASYDSGSNSIVFDGTDDEITVPDNNTLDLTTSMSFEFLFKADSSQNNLYPRLIDKSSYLVHLNQTPPFGVYQNVNTSAGLRQTGTTSNIIQANTWNHLISNYDGQIGKIYINGQLVRTRDFGSVLACTTNGTTLTIGGDTGTGRQLTGNMAKTRVYNRALSESEVKQNYYGGNIVTDGLQLCVDAANLVSYESGSSTTYDMVKGDEGDVYGTYDSNGTLTNGVVFNTMKGGTWGFDGVDDYISFGTQAFQYQYDDAFSLEVWCNPDAVSGFKHLIGVTFASYRLAHSNNSISFRLDANNINTAGGTLVVGEWSHIIATWDPSTFTAKVYQNGVQISSVTNATVDWVSQGTDFRIASSPGENYYFNGKIPIGRVYNKTLSYSEVLQNYNAQKARFGL